jgi:hypothetical protein
MFTAAPCLAKSLTGVGTVQGDVLHTIQSGWVIVDSETSAGTEATRLGEDEMTKKLVDAAIAAGADGDDEITVFPIPPNWNIVRLKAISITADTGSLTHDIYFGSMGDGDDCDLTYSGQHVWTAGDQDSMYDQITFTSGGTFVPLPGDVVTGNTSGETATIVEISALTAGSWAAGTAAGTITYKSATGAFTASETVNITRRGTRQTLNGLTHAAADLTLFNYMDTVVTTAKSWPKAWTTVSPADDTNAEVVIDRMNADVMVVVTSACNADGKLLASGY